MLNKLNSKVLNKIHKNEKDSFKIRIDDIELKTVYSLKDEDREYEYEVVKWYKDKNGNVYCYVIAFIYMQDDDFRLTSYGTRIWDMSKEEIDIFNDVVFYRCI